MENKLIKLPVRYNGNLQAVFESSWVEGLTDSNKFPEVFDLQGWQIRNDFSDDQIHAVGEFIATCINEHEALSKRLSDAEADVKKWRDVAESMVAAFDERPEGEPEDIGQVTRECALQCAKEDLGWPFADEQRT